MKTWILSASLMLVLAAACGGGGSGGSTIPEATPVAQGTDDSGASDDGSGGTADATSTESADPAPQIAGGESVWADSCAMCHGDAGEGQGKTPGVVGEGTLSSYSDAGALMAFISKEMPKDDPGTLDAGQRAAVTAWLLSKRGVQLGAPLSDDNAASLSLQ